jgi:hypothetical protein
MIRTKIKIKEMSACKKTTIHSKTNSSHKTDIKIIAEETFPMKMIGDLIPQ